MTTYAAKLKPRLKGVKPIDPVRRVGIAGQHRTGAITPCGLRRVFTVNGVFCDDGADAFTSITQLGMPLDAPELIPLGSCESGKGEDLDPQRFALREFM